MEEIRQINIRSSVATNKTPTFCHDDGNIITKTIEDMSIYESVLSQEEQNDNNEDNSFEKKVVTTQYINTEEITPHHLTSSTDLRVSTIQFNYEEDELTLPYFINQYMSIEVKSTHMSKNHNHFKTLIELQLFSISKAPITSMKMSHDGHYIAFGNNKGSVTVYEVFGYHQLNNYNTHSKGYLHSQNLPSHLKFFNETAIRKYNDHTESITDISWSHVHHNYLLTASADGYVLLYDVKGSVVPMKKYKHSLMVYTIDVNPITSLSSSSTTSANTQSMTPHSNNNCSAIEVFISASQDNHLRIWSLEKSDRSILAFDIKERLSTVSFSPNGTMIILGTFKGKVMIYSYNPDLETVMYLSSFSIQNSFIINKDQRINHINFISKTKAYIATSDSRIRLVSIPDGRIIHKYKGHVNDSMDIQCNSNDHDDLLISGSEDGGVFVWNKESVMKKNYSYEVFRSGCSFNENKEYYSCVAFANELSTTVFSKRIYKLTTNLFIYSVIITGSSLGNAQVLINIGNVHGIDNRQYTLK